jgi:hypothetical protein
MNLTLPQLNALIRLFIFHTRTVYSVREMREMVAKTTICFTIDEINEEIKANS